MVLDKKKTHPITQEAKRETIEEETKVKKPELEP